MLLSKASKQFMEFTLPSSGFWQFVCRQFGLTNVPKSFAHLIGTLFGPKFEPYVFDYLNDFIIVTETFEDHLLYYFCSEL